MSNRAMSGFPETSSSSNLDQYLQAARNGDSAAFSQLTEPHRLELRTHCYRMLGSIDDAEDMVQETFLRAWRRFETYEGRASIRAWLYKIATNACLDVIRNRPRRSLPGEAADSPPANVGPATIHESAWLEPYPDLWLAPTSMGPEAKYEAYESISLAFMVALQVLPPRQRTVLILGDVLDWQMAEIANVLGISPSAATSLMHRARVTMKERYQSGKLDRTKLGFSGDQIKGLLNRYARAWESADIESILALLTEDASFPMPPLPICYRGKPAIRALITESILSGDAKGRWKLVPVQANGQPGFAFYRLDQSTQNYLPFALQVLSIENGRIVEAVTFGYPGLFPSFDLPLAL